MVLMKVFVANITIILFCFMLLLDVFLQTVLVRKFFIAMITNNLFIHRFDTFVVYLPMSFQMCISSKIFITEVTFEGPFTRVTEEVSVQAAGPRECLVAAGEGAGVEVDAGAAGREAHLVLAPRPGPGLRVHHEDGAAAADLPRTILSMSGVRTTAWLRVELAGVTRLSSATCSPLLSTPTNVQLRVLPSQVVSSASLR